MLWGNWGLSFMAAYGLAVGTKKITYIERYFYSDPFHTSACERLFKLFCGCIVYLLREGKIIFCYAYIMLLAYGNGTFIVHSKLLGIKYYSTFTCKIHFWLKITLMPLSCLFIEYSLYLPGWQIKLEEWWRLMASGLKTFNSYYRRWFDIVHLFKWMTCN